MAHRPLPPPPHVAAEVEQDDPELEITPVTPEDEERISAEVQGDVEVSIQQNVPSEAAAKGFLGRLGRHIGDFGAHINNEKPHGALAGWVVNLAGAPMLSRQGTVFVPSTAREWIDIAVEKGLNSGIPDVAAGTTIAIVSAVAVQIIAQMVRQNVRGRATAQTNGVDLLNLVLIGAGIAIAHHFKALSTVAPLLVKHVGPYGLMRDGGQAYLPYESNLAPLKEGESPSNIDRGILIAIYMVLQQVLNEAQTTDVSHAVTNIPLTGGQTVGQKMASAVPYGQANMGIAEFPYDIIEFLLAARRRGTIDEQGEVVKGFKGILNLRIRVAPRVATAEQVTDAYLGVKTTRDATLTILDLWTPLLNLASGTGSRQLVGGDHLAKAVSGWFAGGVAGMNFNYRLDYREPVPRRQPDEEEGMAMQPTSGQGRAEGVPRYLPFPAGTAVDTPEREGATDERAMVPYRPAADPSEDAARPAASDA